MRRWIALHPDRFRLISSVADIQRCKQEATLGITFDIEGMCPVENDLSLVQTFYELGVRWMLIAYNRNNKAGGGCLDIDTGLTDSGRAVIDEMERVGMVLCLSHTGARTASEALVYSRNPVIFSHSNPYGDVLHARNVSDELMQACAAGGGVVGLSGIGPFLGASTDLVSHLVRQICYAVDVVGADHVGLGLDYVFDQAELSEHVRLNPALYPPGLDAEDGFPMVPPEGTGAIAEGLARNNFTNVQIRGILGENWLRIASRVWR
jgi:membrane dipeptidase